MGFGNARLVVMVVVVVEGALFSALARGRGAGILIATFCVVVVEVVVVAVILLIVLAVVFAAAAAAALC